MDKIFDTVVFVHRYWAIMAHSEKLLDRRAFGNVKFLTQKAKIPFAMKSCYIKQETPGEWTFLEQGSKFIINGITLRNL